MGLQYKLHLERAPLFTQEALKMFPCPEIIVNYEVGNKIKFTDLKTKYSSDKDIMIGYSVLDGTNTSTRDWIGIFQRGWTNLEQYITFEYAILPTIKSKAINRSAVFVKTFFSKQVSHLTDYQFVYVSRKAHILGMSPYFRFESLTPDDITNDTGSLTKDHEGQKGMTENDGYPPTIVKVDNVDSSFIEAPIVVTNEEMKVTQSEQTAVSRDLSNFAKSTAANRDQFLRLHVDKLSARVTRLERDLELARVRAKQDKLARACLIQRLEAYQAFVKDMFAKLTNDNAIKIMDQTGTEVIIRRVSDEELSSNRKKLSDETARNELEIPTDSPGFDNDTKDFEEIMTSEIQEDVIDPIQEESKEILQSDNNNVTPERELINPEIELERYVYA